MLKNILIIDKHRVPTNSVEGISNGLPFRLDLVQALDTIIVVDEEEGVFTYTKNRYLDPTLGTFPLSHLDAHIEIIKRISS